MKINEELEKIKSRAVYYLGRRDYGSKELFIKLEQKFPEANVEHIEETISIMQEYNYLCDERFVKVFIRQEKRNKNGPLKIKMKLKQKGIKDNLIDEYLNSNDEDFFDNCFYLLEKKSKGIIKDIKEKQKLYRFLASRGYFSDHINNAFENLEKSS